MAKKSVKRQRNSNVTRINKTLRQSKLMLTPLEYLKRSNTTLFGNDLLSNGTINSISLDKFRKNNLTKLDASSVNLIAFEYSEIIQELLDNDILNYEEHQHIIDCMLKIDFECYFSKDIINSKTNLNAQILKILGNNLIPGASVLNIGSGLGALSVIFANMVNVRGLYKNYDKGSVTSIEINKDKVNKIKENISKDSVNKDLLDEVNFSLIENNGKYGYPSKSIEQLYDIIYVGLATKKNHAPKFLKSQLKEGGVMFIPIVNEGKQQVRIYQRINGKIKYLNSELNINFSYF